MKPLQLVCLLCALLAPLRASAEDPVIKPIEIYDQRVCMVNAEAISKRDVEERMEGVAERLYAFRHEQEMSGLWTTETEKQWNDLYGPSYRDALRRLIRERLMLQSASEEKTPIDEKDFQRRLDDTLTRLRSQGQVGPNGFSVEQVKKRVRENMLLNAYRGKFYSLFENPSRPEVQQYYKENINRYQRKAGVKVRLIRIDRFVTDKFTGKQTVRENAWDQAEKLRQDVQDYGANFKQLAKIWTDDPDGRKDEGLLKASPTDPYFSLEDYNNPSLVAALRGLKKGEVSKVFAFGDASWAIAYIEDTREAGAAPLEGAQYDEIYKKLLETKTRKKEDTWFRKTLAKAYIVQVVEGHHRPLPAEFFFPEDQTPVAAAKKAEK